MRWLPSKQVKEFAKGIELGRLIGGEAFLERRGSQQVWRKRRSWVRVFMRIAPSLAPASASLSTRFRRSADFVVAGGLFLGQVEVENLFDLFGEFGRDFRFLRRRR